MSDEGILTLDESEINWISKHFLILQQLRQDYLMTNKKQSHLAKAGLLSEK